MRRQSIAWAGAVLSGIAISSIFFWKYDDWIVIPKMREQIQFSMKDPDSAQFRNEKIGVGNALCGEVNSKNGFGAYSGYERFISVNSSSNYLESTGKIETESTEEVVERMDKEIAILKAYNSLPVDIVNNLRPSKERIAKLAIKEVFADKWREFCGG